MANVAKRPLAPLLVLSAAVASLATLLVYAWIDDPARAPVPVLWGLALAIVAGIAVAFWYRQVARGQGAERDLVGLEARMSGIVESAMDPIISVDDDARVVLFNAAAERTFRWPRTAVLGQSIDMLLPQRFREGHRHHLRRFAETGVTSRQMGVNDVLTALRANGEEFPIEASISQHVEHGRKVLTVILRDITERVRAEQRVNQSEARLRGILDSAMDGVITVDHQQKIVLFNAAAERMFMCSSEQAIGAPLAWLIPDRFRDRHGEHVRAFGETGVASRRMGGSRIVTGLRRTGEEFPLDASISQLSEAGAKFYTVVLRDVTERAQAEAEIRRAHEELRELGAAAHTTREDEKTRIARELHDELGASLTMLQMDVAWCRANLPVGADGCRMKLDRMEGLLKATAAATRRIATDLRPLILDDLGLPDALEWLAQDFTQRTGIACNLLIGEELPDLAPSYATAVFRIVQESLVNVGKHARASQAQVVIECNDGSMTISIIDDGVGFSPDQPRKPQAYGLLGLRERASLLDGAVRIASAPGQGTRIEIRLPIRQAEAS